MLKSDVKSSNIKRIGWAIPPKRPGVCLLFVQFKNGSAYAYAGVPLQAYHKLLDAESVGKHFAKNIKGKFAYKRIA